MKTKINFSKIFSLLLLFLIFTIIFLRCRKESCEYLPTIDPPANAGCTMVNSLNLSTGIDKNGNVIAAALGAVDPFWHVINNPPLTSHTSPLTVTGSAYVMNFMNLPDTSWANQPNVGTIAPVDLGPNGNFGDNNALNSNGEAVPYIFERSFCVLSDTKVDFNFTAKADDGAIFTLVNNNTNTIISTSSMATLGHAITWSAASMSLSAGSYSIRCQLINTGSVILGFSFKGNLTTTNGDLAISNNVDGCCENNTISILNIEESNCNGIFDSADVVGQNWTFNIKNSSGTIIKTGTTDVNGNIFFTGLANGTYTIEIVPKSGWTSNNPTGGSQTVTLSNNNVSIINFYNCKK